MRRLLHILYRPQLGAEILAAWIAFVAVGIAVRTEAKNVRAWVRGRRTASPISEDPGQ